jgi:hypothetical protein
MSKLILPRRKLLLGAAATICAPALVRAQSLGMMGVSTSQGGGGGSTVALDAISALQSASSVPSLSWTHTPTGTPTAVAVVLNNFGSGGPGQGATSVTYGGVSMTRAQTVDNSVSSTTDVWGLANPPSGAQTVIVNLPTGSFPLAASITVTGSDTTTCFSNSNSANGSSTTPSVTVNSQVGDLVVDFVGSFTGAGGSTAGGSQTLRWSGTLGGDFAMGSTLAGASPNVTMTWTFPSSVAWGQVAASFKHA